MRRTLVAFLAVLASTSLFGCAGLFQSQVPGPRQNASVVDYLYPDTASPPKLTESQITLRPPVRVGIAFVPGGNWNSDIPGQQQMKLAEQIKNAFSAQPFIASIEIIPSGYLRPKGGFDDLQNISRVFQVDIVALLSYDQIQFNDTNALAFGYWTLVGAYVLHGDQFDVQTLVDASVFDIASQRLLFEAPGTDRMKGTASIIGFSEAARTARNGGFERAVADMIPKLNSALTQYRERIKADPSVHVERRPGYQGG